MKLNSFITTAIITTVFSLLIGCSSSDDDSGAGDGVTDTDTTGTGAPIDCGTATASNLTESDIGDLSGDIAAPTFLETGPGTSTLIANTSGGDLDYVTFTVGPCDTLSQLTVDDYTSAEGDPVAFLAIQNGSTFTVPAASAVGSEGELLGFSHFGFADIGQDILPQIGAEPSTIGFMPPLPAGDYTIWLNQTTEESQATLTFLVDRVIEPSP